MVPSIIRAQEWDTPAAGSLTLSTTRVGVLRSVMPPYPSWPEPAWPQHDSTLPIVTAQVCAPPATTRAPPVKPVTGTGEGESLISPLPSWPLPPAPQQAIEVSA